MIGDVKRHSERDQLIHAYAPLVEKIARRACAKLPPSVELDDVQSAAMIGLIDAIDKYDERKGTQFKVYAEIRIRGAIIDELRQQDWVPRSVRERATLLERTRRALISKLDREPSPQELADELSMPLDEYFSFAKKAQAHRVTRYEDMRGAVGEARGGDRDPLERLQSADGSSMTPDEVLQQEDDHRALRDALKKLPERQRVVVSLYYFEEMKLKEIGALLGVTESRISQLLSQSHQALKDHIQRLNQG
jgi:RNA polymerase sigma factor for flagellar operon FliA